MEFFNQKEEVIDIQLTQHGKRLLSAGKFKPTYYAFFDKDILYNSEFGGFIESQNNTETRIKDETPRLKVQHNFIGVETQFNEMKKLAIDSDLKSQSAKEALQDVENKFFGVDTTIGTTRLESIYNPSWDIKFYNENLSSSVNSYSGSGQIIRIPQLESIITYNSYATNKPDNTNDDYDDDPSSDAHDAGENIIIFSDGSQIFIKDDFILLGIEEKNTNFYNENFEIEIFMEETEIVAQNQSRKKLTPLRFLNDEEADDEDINPNFVEYYLDIEIDEEINDQLLCKLVHQEDKRSLYVKNIFTCPDEADFQDQEIDIYEDDNLGDPC